MANIRFMYDNGWSRAVGTISAVSAATGLPASASQNPDRTYAYRSLSQIADQALTRDYGSSLAGVTSVAIADVRLQNGGALRLEEAGTGGAPGAWNLVATLPAMDPYTKVTYAFFNAVTARHWRIKWVNGSGAADYVELGYAHLGPYFEPVKGVRVPAGMGRPNPSTGSLSVDGQATFARRKRFFRGAWDFGMVGQADMNSLLAMDDVVGIDTPFFAVLDHATGVSWQAWLLRQTQGVEHPRGVSTKYDVSIAWEEAR